MEGQRGVRRLFSARLAITLGVLDFTVNLVALVLVASAGEWTAELFGTMALLLSWVIWLAVQGPKAFEPTHVTVWLTGQPG